MKGFVLYDVLSGEAKPMPDGSIRSYSDDGFYEVRASATGGLEIYFVARGVSRLIVVPVCSNVIEIDAVVR